MRRRAFLAAAATGTAALAGCGYRHGGGESRWSFGHYDVVGLTTVDGRVLAVTREAGFDIPDSGTLRAFRSDGRTGFEISVTFPVSAVAVGEQAVYAGRFDGTVGAFPPTKPTETRTRDVDEYVADDTRARRSWESVAAPDWSRTYRDPLPSSPDDESDAPLFWGEEGGPPKRPVEALAVAGDRVYAGGDRGVSALAVQNGRRLWQVPFPGTVHAVTPAEPGPYLVVDDSLVALARDGSYRWSRRDDRIGGAGARPVTDANGVYVAGSGGVAAYGHDGRRRWVTDDGSARVQPTLVDGTLYHAGTRAGVVARATDGSEAWSTRAGGAGSRIAVADGRVYTVRNGLTAVEDGATVWGVPVDLGRYDPQLGPVVAGDAVAVASEEDVQTYWRSQLDRSEA